MEALFESLFGGQPSLPGFGSLIVFTILVLAAYTFSVSVLAATSKPGLLKSARLGAYSVSAAIFTGTALLSYGFYSHDFRIRYVSEHSARTMNDWYLFAALWGGQDGSLLWWTFLLGAFGAACVAWMRGRYRELQPIVIATLMVITSFFAVLMMFAANPFDTNMGGSSGTGTPMNPLLQNYWMMIHPPTLYLGFVGCSIPFAFATAALITGRLDNEWIIAVRKWMLVAFLFLSIGNVLGMIWAYEELGWGGFWAWDPVENAACLPWFTAAAYVHSTIIQERRNMFKVWNVVLIAVTFFLTIFGTFLTRSGVIASVHSFAKSDIGDYFAWFLLLLFSVCVGGIVWRLPMLRGKAQIESVASREGMFVINNWALLGAMSFICAFTITPWVTELWSGQEVTVGPPFYNKWMAPIGLVIFALMGLAPLFGWRKSSKDALKRAFTFPGTVVVIVTALHFAFGNRLGYPPIVTPEAVEAGFASQMMAKLSSVFPALTVSLAALNVAVVIQEFVRGVRARRSSTKKKGEQEDVLTALLRLVGKSRRRYGGYIVHLGIVGMYMGFVGSAWQVQDEVAMDVGDRHTMSGYELVYHGTRMCPGNPKCSTEEQSVKGMRMLLADIEVKKNGKTIGTLSPAKHMHQKPPQQTTEVGLMRGFWDDLYLVLATADPKTKRATFTFHVNPFVGWIWLGLLVLIVGTSVSLWPEVSNKRVTAWTYVRSGIAATAGILMTIFFAQSLSQPFSKHFTVTEAAKQLASNDKTAGTDPDALNRGSLKSAGSLESARQ